MRVIDARFNSYVHFFITLLILRIGDAVTYSENYFQKLIDIFRQA